MSSALSKRMEEPVKVEEPVKKPVKKKPVKWMAWCCDEGFRSIFARWEGFQSMLMGRLSIDVNGFQSIDGDSVDRWRWR